MKRYDVITLDMGYTLAYFHPSDLDLQLQVYRSIGLDPEPEALRKAMDTAWAEMAATMASHEFAPTRERDVAFGLDVTRRTLHHLGIDDEALVQPAEDAFHAIYRAPGAMRCYPEVHDTLAELRARGYRLGIVSNWGWDLGHYVHSLGLEPYFETVVISAQVGYEKPHPHIFLHALRTLGGRPERTLHVGDNYEADVAGARSVGMNALWLDRAGNGGHDDCVAVRSLSELLAHLEG